MNLYNWGKINKTNIEAYVQNKDYKGLLNEYYTMSGMSLTQLAKSFQCSRRALGRYLSGERQVPFAIVKIMLQSVEVEAKSADDNSDDNGMFVWYGGKDTLFNIMRAYRVLHFKWNQFDAACNLNIPIEKLFEYESGKRKIPITDLHKIMEVYGLKLEELFPALVSYDGRKTFLPLKPVSIFEIDGVKYNLFEDKIPLYVNPENEELLLWPSFPIMRYDKDGTALLNYMPKELTIDEYVNTDDLIFLKEDLETYYEYDFEEKKLPPVYKHLLEETSDKKCTRQIYDRKVYGITFLDDYKVKLDVSPKTITFDLRDYVFSDSVWYSMLQDETYFNQGKLQYVGDEIYQNLCIVWPDRQYVRIIELYSDKYPSKYLAQKRAITSNTIYENWTLYK